MSIVDGKGLVTWEGGLFEPNSDLLRRVQWAFAQIRSAGGHIELNEAGRPFGVPGDMRVRNAWQTASGVSTVWFQWGRYQRSETPSAANPNSGELASEHTQGLAIDCDAKDVYTATLRAKFFAMVGMKQTISSESWHWAIRGPASVNVASAAAVTAISTPTAPPILEEDDDNMELIRRGTTGEIAIFGGGFANQDKTGAVIGKGRHIFASQAEYERFKSMCDMNRKAGNLKALDLPAYRDIQANFTVSDGDWAFMCGVYAV